MNYNINWKSIGLTENPFTVSPPDDPNLAVWAGMEELKNEFNEVLREARGSSPTQVILCRGPVGGGKTHASLYFSLNEHWPDQEPSVRDIFVLRVPTPKETGKPDRDFYIDVMESIGLENIRDAVRRAIDEVGVNTVQSTLRKIMVSADLSSALIRLGDHQDNPLLNAYFLGKCTTSELRKLGLNRNIEKTQDYFRVLAGVFQCQIGLSLESSPHKHSRLCLWLDEMEDFVYFTPSQYRPFGQGLRELVDRLPSFFTLFMNFTLTSSEEYEEIELILGKYLIDRVTRNIFFDEMRDEDKVIYVSQLLASYSTDEPKESELYPFRAEALKLLLSELPRRTPRDVNKRCRNALIKAFGQGIFEEHLRGWIESDFVQKISREELDKELG
ncbi:hypothetical protein [Pseudanabaena sp. 'Roaring Creek']|uniref:hypothetical protein n=1 Tax=Pseudanabaena sp. 'Roaring Creek' TaxID=1681830 RepID=UPI0006D831D8|nr:hypothetical protein [Pseudanabaena sp. 'Roaring Creek']